MGRNRYTSSSEARLFGNKMNAETDHYTISSTATQPQTIFIGEAIESLYAAYTAFFRNILDIKEKPAKLKLILYRDRNEFIAHHRGIGWAEAFYETPNCHAYYSEGKANPYHWMIHEGTHQLNTEVAYFNVQNWIDEGLATYFGASKMKDGKLQPGRIDVNAYPIWWLPGFSLAGTLQTDIKNGKIIPLRSLISGSGGPDINKHFNLYYIEYWSLIHFLFHYKRGQHAEGCRELIAEGGSLESFKKRIGPMDRIQGQWYEYLRQKIVEANTIKQT